LKPSNILVVGAGPVGSVAALACARFGHRVTLLEAQPRVDDMPRASTTQPPTLEILAELGLIDEYHRVGLVARTFEFWDRPTRTCIAEFDFERLRGETAFPYVVQTEQHKLANMAIERLRALPNAEVVMGCAVGGLEQDGDGVTVRAGEREFRADYVIAADGGRSTVRKRLGIEFEGYTWPERFLVVTTKFDFAAAVGCCTRTYMADPQEWTNLFKVAGDDLKGRWRAVFNTREDETDQEALSDAAVRARLARSFAPDADWVHLNLYNVHQRVAKQFRKGRVFLCGDAAHVNNPIGGLGLNCGIHEAWDLARLLSTPGADLDAYERRRRPLNIEYVQEQTTANKRRLEEKDPARRQMRFDELRAMADDPAKHKAFLMRASLLESARRAALAQ
jgi:3-(3-hydroxy-phenyl)propionate hydroxylase